MILNICNKPSIWHLLLLLLFSPSPAQALSIEMATQPGKLKYDLEVFSVRPSEQVRLTFVNNDARDVMEQKAFYISVAPP